MQKNVKATPPLRVERHITNEEELEIAAGLLRADIRNVAGLDSDWNKTSPMLKRFYRDLVKRLAEPQA